MTAGPQTVPALLDEGVRRFGDHPAVVDQGAMLTYTDLAREAGRVSRALLAAGIEPGDRVALWAPNRVEFILALLGAENIGAAVVPLNTRYRGHEALVVLERSRAAALFLVGDFLGTDYLEILRKAVLEQRGESGDGPVPGLPTLHTVVDITGSQDGSDGVSGWQHFLDSGARVSDADLQAARDQVSPETLCDILFTSGTTGVPKGVMMQHQQTLGHAAVWAAGADLDESDRYAIVNPFFHSFGYKAGFMAAFLAGTTVYPVVTFDPVALMSLIEGEGITVLPGAPTIFLTLINHERRTDFDLSSLRFSIAGAASVPETLFEQMLDVLGFDHVAQAYGLTECPVSTVSRPGEDPRHIAETTGPAVPGLEIQVVDGQGESQPTGRDGEILIRGANVMIGYFENPEATADTIDPEGWLHTGDVGRLDEHGCLKI